ncbi:MAG: undecaprenyl-diphosphate phosphatase [Bacteroidales bacterium]|nr:undecaprenyl-diphosphate phosphatase [Bacteroidales bacterium]
MDWLEALILGILQGLTEFLPVSSSGHLELGKNLLGINAKDSLYFTIVVHGATVLSTIIVFWKDISKLIKGLLKLEWNEETKYIFKILVSMIPVGFVGVFFKDEIKNIFSHGNIIFVGAMLLITALLLAITYFAKTKTKKTTFADAFIIGIAQAIAVLPGISRSGSTIATGLLLGNKKEEVAKFSFLMVLIPILGENFLDLFTGEFTTNSDIGITPLIIGFLAAFISGLFACKWMINIVKKGKLIYFAIYCFIIGITAIILS